MFQKAKEVEETSMEASYPRFTVRSSHFPHHHEQHLNWDRVSLLLRLLVVGETVGALGLAPANSLSGIYPYIWTKACRSCRDNCMSQ